MISKISSRFSFSKGFTLIELMIVVAIIGILAAIAIPNFVKFQCRSKQSEAKTNLKAMYVAEESYYGEYDAFIALTAAQTAPGGTNPVGFQAKGQKIRYSYTATGGTTFVGNAKGFESSVINDEWQINQDNRLDVLSNTCL